MAVKSPDLDQFRRDAAAITGNPVADFGMLPDQDHLEGGGYHCGLTDLVRIGRFHPPRTANVGSSREDYSARQARDRNAIDDRSAAVDGPDNWPRGGRAAWIRHNNMIVAQMQARDPELGALRAVNFTPDGKVKRRYDSLHPEAGVIASTDTVLWHTHYEFWRDTLATPLMQRTLKRLLQIMRAAVANVPLTAVTTRRLFMALSEEQEKDIWEWIAAQMDPNTPDTGRPSDRFHFPPPFKQVIARLGAIEAALAASALREQDMLTALTALAQAGSGNFDVAVILARIDERSADVTGLLARQAARIAELEKQLAATREAAVAGLSPAERAALDGNPDN
ncbi:hypothetical protein KZZ52_23985 [Dactylosporangium sp. AC04546]|uniref:hypothetical protein n=1 Tax=Dactylosporangium sp. AC04546 TaxID=2862460 RepID=UPI001EE0B581|nr:hypothetical protein [Dactylosporangium sp. AC04546]WVK88336.1 hypothetical protein KZZ52_23985 [Dactylosporangium sp. AC04546]